MSVLDNVQYFFDGIEENVQLSAQSYINLRNRGELRYAKKYLETLIKNMRHTARTEKNCIDLCHSIILQDFKEETKPDLKTLDTDMTDKNLEKQLSEFCTNWLLFFNFPVPLKPEDTVHSAVSCFNLFKKFKEQGKLYLIKDFYTKWCEILSVQLISTELKSVQE
jgi:hypothetical protein